MELTANILDNAKVNVMAFPYKENEFYTEEEFKEGILKQLKHEWKSFHTACEMLRDLWNAVSKEDTDARKSLYYAENLVGAAFEMKLMEYLMMVNQEWMQDVAKVVFNQSSGVLDIWKYDKDGKLIDENPYTIENW